MATQGLCIVTGATGSIGKEIARALAARGCNIVLACRNTARAEELRRELLAVAGCGDVIVAKVSLDSLDSISDFCNRIIALNSPIAAILHNAGVMCRYRSLTADGFEQSLAVNLSIWHRCLSLTACCRLSPMEGASHSPPLSHESCTGSPRRFFTNPRQNSRSLAPTAAPSSHSRTMRCG